VICRIKAEGPLDQLEDGGVVEDPMIQSRVVLDAASEGRNEVTAATLCKVFRKD
jgi:hypothetical protein